MSARSSFAAPGARSAIEPRLVEEDWCREALSTLCSIDTTPGNEGRLLPELCGLLERLGAATTLQTVDASRVNVLATWGEPRVLFTTHLDTVAPFVPPRLGTEAFHGRGACDAKGQIVAQLAAIRRLLADGRHDLAGRGLAWLGVVGEETDGAGAAAALELAPRLRRLEAIVGGEPTENRLATAQAGFLHLTLQCRGRRGHGAVGVDDENALWRLIGWLDLVRSAPPLEHPVFGREAFSLGRVEGGEGANVVAGEATAELVVRTVPGSRFLELCRSLAPADSTVRVHLAEPPAELAGRAGFDGDPVPFGSDVPTLSALVPPGRSFLCGPGSIRDAHRDDERLRWSDLASGVDLLTRLGRELLDEPERLHVDAAGGAT